MENVYQRRADLVPNLLETVKGASNFEKETLTAVTDARVSRIINEIMVPHIQASNRDEAVTASVKVLVNVASGQGLPGDRTPEQEPLAIWHWIFYGILGVAFLILLITHPSLAFWLLINILASNRRNGSQSRGGWGGGGFIGGGGRSGGGGASGSW